MRHRSRRRGCVWKLPDPWTHRTRPPILAKPQNGFAQASTRLIVVSLFRRTQDQNLSESVRYPQILRRRRLADSQPQRPRAREDPPDGPGRCSSSGEDEAPAVLRFKKGMDHIEKLGHAPDFVDNHGRAPGRPPNEIAQPLGPGGELARDVGLEEVDDERIGQSMAKPRRFAGAPGAEEEKALPRRSEQSALQFHCESQNGNDDS